MTDTVDADARPVELRPFPARGARRPDLDAVAVALLVEEGAALDECRYGQWLDLIDEDFLYQVPVPLLREDPSLPRHSERALLFEATKGVLAMKLGRAGKQHAWSDRPSAVVRHFLSGVRVFETDEPQTWRVDCNVLAAWHRGQDESASATAARQDVIAHLGTPQARLLRRRVLLDTEVATHEQLSIIF
ncbi:aromatic-ring-hydroxylating dioxygenase subunit beta [Kutzneria sp. NPDC052558]|uniref:aromatic-ring-hydroxylating dioxygenase subunit beta n=1 Tax=Kutzneria sp. NPDC052558 TaxID=3364121 RepID=UPI0037C8C3FF